ncbi:hypothetical protein B0H13DRAFT_1177678 [Mycena leptocephala]|nr:hypothetical protein B0H13DRAFT_1177678 [Mycena leptocephala]
MHPALTIAELLPLIFEEIKRRRFSSEPDLPSLAAVARTCTGFRDPALDILWRRQVTLKNFFSCFPIDAQARVYKKGGVGVVAGVGIPRPTTETDWERPRLYSRRVKILCLGRPDEWFDRTSIEEFEKIFVNFLGPLFPNLEVLELHLPEYTPVRCLDVLLSPRIQEIDLDFSSGPLLSQVVPALGERCPLLTTAKIRTWSWNPFPYLVAELQSVSTFVRSLQCIECLAVRKLDREALLHLGRLPTLTTLSLEGTKIPMISLPRGDHLFSSLKFLDLRHITMAHLIAFINLTMNCPLERLEIKDIDDRLFISVVEQLYSTLATQCSRWHDTLRDLTILPGVRPGGAAPALFSITGDVLRHLFCFKNMVSVDLSQPLGFNLHDGDIFDLASSWPRLDYLSLEGNHAPSHVTLRALYAFVRHCPNLSYLVIALDATDIAGLESDGSEGRACQTMLTHIDLGYSSIATAAPVAAFLSATFPNLTAISSAYYDIRTDPESEEAEYGDRWKEVDRLLRESAALLLRESAALLLRESAAG